MKHLYATAVASLFLLVFCFNIADCSCLKKESKVTIDPAYKADLIIFSYNRPLQLYALLESLDTYVTGLASTTVLYRASSVEYEHAYNQVFADFADVKKHKQGDNPAADFKPLTLQAFSAGLSTYVLFAVDDIIVTDHVCIADCARALEGDTQAYGFYLRLGLNLDYCYSMNGSQALPSFTHLVTPSARQIPSEQAPAITPETIYAWRLAQGQHDWGYPNTVDMTIYRKKDIAHDLQEMAYSSPNTLEAQWSMRAQRIMGKKGFCYRHTKIVNLPLNRVQKDWYNRAMENFSSAELLAIFKNNQKMAIAPLYKIKNRSAHMEYTPEFIAR